MDFDKWMEQVDAIFLDYYQLPADSFEDWLWYDDYTSGLSPQQAFDSWGEEQR